MDDRGYNPHVKRFFLIIMSSTPLISVIIVAFNHANFIEEAINSVAANKYSNIELIVMDNGSSDNTLEILKQIKSNFPLKILHHSQGLSVNKAYNEAIQESKGEYIIFVPGDDVSLENRIDEQMQIFQENPKLSALYANGRFYIDGKIEQQVHNNEEMSLLFNETCEKVLEYLYVVKGFMIQTAMFKRELLLDCGGFDEDSIADDWILNIRIFRELKDKSEYKYQAKDVFLYRQHSSNNHKNFPRQAASMIEVVKKYVPEKTKKTTLANMYFYLGKAAFLVYNERHFGLGLKFMFLSFLTRPSLSNLLKSLLIFILGFAFFVPGCKSLYLRLKESTFISKYIDKIR